MHAIALQRNDIANVGMKLLTLRSDLVMGDKNRPAVRPSETG